MSLYALILILLVLARWEISACPTNCSCYISGSFFTSCDNKGLTRIPSRIPEESVIVRLQVNKIQTIHKDAFQGLTGILNLYLNHNEIQTVDSNAFHGLILLRSLTLHHNKIQTIHKDAFHGLTDLIELHLQNNMLTTINPDIFVGLHKLRSLFFESNAFTCDCNIRRFRLWLLSKPYIGNAGAQCSNGTDITSLGDNDIICSGEVNLEHTCIVLESTAECGPNAFCKSVDGNLVCKCLTGYYDSNFQETAGICIPEKEPDILCLHSEESIECVPHAKCIDHGDALTCTCSSGYYDFNFGASGGMCMPEVNLDHTCPVYGSTAECGPNAVCKSVCKCSTGYYDSNFQETAGICLPEKESDMPCLHSGESIECVSRAKCIDHGDVLTCTCSSGYYDSNFGVNGGICIPVEHIGDACHPNTSSVQCVPNAECKTDDNKHICRCSEGFKESVGVCVTDTEPKDKLVIVKHIGDACHPNTSSVQCVPNAECKTDDNKHICRCSEGFKESVGVCVTDTEPKNKLVIDTKENSGNVSLILAVVAVCLVTITTVVHLAVCICRKMRGSSKAAGSKNGGQRNANYDNASFEMGTDKNVYDQIERQEEK